MNERLIELFQPKVSYRDPLTARRAHGLLYFLAAAIVILVIYDVYLLLDMYRRSAEFGLLEGFSMLAPFICGGLFAMVRYGYYHQAAIGFVVLSLLALVVSDLANTSINDLALVFPILSAGVLLGWRSTLAALVLVLGLILRKDINNLAEEGVAATLLTKASALSGIAAALIVFGINIQNAARRFISAYNQLRGVTKGIGLSGINVSEAQLALEAINLIRDQLNFTFASVYLLGGGETAQRVLGGLNLQQINIDSDIELQVGNAISEAVRTGQIAEIKPNSSDIMRQHLLQGIQTALALPISEQDQVIAVLDVQTEDAKSFSEDEIETIKLIAAQLGLALSHSRLIASLRNDLTEQNNIISRQRQRLLNYERSERRATTSAWATYLQQRGIEYMGFDLKDDGVAPIVAYSMDSDLEMALQTGDVQVQADGDYQIVRVTITLRGQSLGAMSFRVPQGSQAIGPRQQELIRSVVQRLALALENKRLFEQSQAQAQRESKANEVGNMLLSSTDIDTVLQLAADQFNRALGAIQTQIHLRPEAQELVEGEETA